MKYTFKDLLTSLIWLSLAGSLVALDTYVLNNFLGEIDSLILILLGIGVLGMIVKIPMNPDV
ncbi:hypothetical protein N8959_00025 [bacterium]|nr:hypothetical protein [bacterium]